MCLSVDLSVSKEAFGRCNDKMNVFIDVLSQFRELSEISGGGGEESGRGSYFFSSQKGEGQIKLRALKGEGQKKTCQFFI